jgi:hypothetical protein
VLKCFGSSPSFSVLMLNALGGDGGTAGCLLTGRRASRVISTEMTTGCTVSQSRVRGYTIQSTHGENNAQCSEQCSLWVKGHGSTREAKRGQPLREGFDRHEVYGILELLLHVLHVLSFALTLSFVWTCVTRHTELRHYVTRHTELHRTRSTDKVNACNFCEI